MVNYMPERKTQKLPIVMCLAFIVTVVLIVFRTIYMIKGFNASTMQYDIESNSHSHVIVIVCLAMIALIFLIGLFIKNYQISNFKLPFIVKILSSIMFLLISLFNFIFIMTTNKASYSVSSSYSAYRFILIISTIFALASGIYLLFTLFEKKKNLNIISCVLPLWAATSILASYFNPNYTLSDPNRMVYCIMLMCGAIMFIKAAKNLVYETDNYLISILASVLSCSFALLFLVPNVAYIIAAQKPVSLFASDNIAALNLIVFSVGILMESLKKKKDAALD